MNALRLGHGEESSDVNSACENNKPALSMAEEIP